MSGIIIYLNLDGIDSGFFKGVMIMSKVRFKIENDTFFNNGRIILDSIPQIKDEILSALSKEEEITESTRSKKGVSVPGITADSLNKSIRRCMENGSFKGETHVENGVFFDTTKEGFDFISYDEKHNVARLYNYYMGAVGVLNGDEKILELFKKLRLSRRDWEQEVMVIQNETGHNVDYVCEKQSLTVAGEIQFGNWALIYRDLFRLLAAANNPGIDLYIYITAEDKLSDLLSDQTVSYKQAVKVIEEYNSVIKTPIWVIGLGIDFL